MIVLPKGAFMAIRDKKESNSTLILGDNIEQLNTGTITYTSEELNKYQGCKVKFRENFLEEVPYNGKTYLYFRDFNSSIYYVVCE